MAEVQFAGCDELTMNASQCAAQMYHCAQESMSAEFKPAFFRQLKQVVDFERAVWVSYSTNFNLDIYNAEYFNLGSLLGEPSNFKFERCLISTACFADNFRFGGVGCYPADITQQQHWQTSDFYQSYGLTLGLEHSLCIGLDNIVLGCKEVIFLFRSQLDDFFDCQNIDALTFLMPHIVSAVQVSDRTVNQYQIIRKHSRQAICGAHGKIIEIDSGLCEMIPSRFVDKNTISIDFIECCIDGNIEVDGVAFNATSIGGKYILLATRDDDLLAVLTKTEKKVAVLMTRGVSTKTIGDLLGSALRTVEKHQASIYKKVGTKNKAETVGLLGGYINQ